jgi:hypothetical protein
VKLRAIYHALFDFDIQEVSKITELLSECCPPPSQIVLEVSQIRIGELRKGSGKLMELQFLGEGIFDLVFAVRIKLIVFAEEY